MSVPFGEAIVTFLLKTVWPWFVKYVWPLIAKHLLSMVSRMIKHFLEWLERLFNDRMGSRGEQADENAKKAEEAAKEATSDVERAAREAEARVWRTVAEQFRQENELLKRQAAEFAARELDAAKQDIVRSTPVLDEDKTGLVLEIDGEKTGLPALPKP